MDFDDFESDYIYIVRYVLENFDLSATEEGVAKRFLDVGFDELSEKQKNVLETYIIPKGQIECSNCGSEIPACELEVAPLCSWCNKILESREKE